MRRNSNTLFFPVVAMLCIIVTFTCKKIEKSMLVSTGEVSNILTNSADASGIVVDLGDGATQHGHCYGTSPNVSTAGSKTQLGTPPTGGFTSQLTSLTAGTKYYIKAYMSNGSETVYGKEISFTTVAASLASLTTTEVTSITTTTAASGGNISNDGGAAVTERGVCWNTSTGPSISNSKTTNGTGTGSYSSSLTGLAPGTTYYLRAYATNSAGTAYGNEVTFVTLTPAPVTPTLTTTDITGITQTTATGGGNITGDGGASVSARGVCWSTSANPTVALSTKTTDGTGTGSYTSNLTGLAASTTYYVRAYATNSAGTVYGNEVSFTTSAPVLTVPTLTTTSVTNITQITASSGGNISGNGGASVSVRGVCWSTSATPTISLSTKTADGTGTGSFTSSLTGLTANTKYYVRAYATNSVGTAYGDEISFTTSSVAAVLPTLTTTAVSALASNTVNSGGNITSDGGAAITARGVCWGVSANPTIANSTTSDGTGSGIFGSKLTGLAANTTYNIRAYATNSAGTAYGNELSFTTTIQVTDADGNKYNTVKTGNQLWMQENLKTTKYSNSDLIGTTATASSDISAVSEPKYQWAYDGNESVVATYGRLYTWHVAADNRRLCPAGWHTPTDAEWSELTTFLGGESVAGGKLKETGTTHWNSPNTDATNATLFTALPGGNRVPDGAFGGYGSNANFWSVTSGASRSSWARGASNSSGNLFRGENDKKYGFSVRCLQGSGEFLPALTTAVISGITATDALSGGNITSDGGAVVTARGVCWSTNNNPTADLITKSADGSGTGNFTSSISGLSPVTTYYVRAYATNSVGTAYGNEISFNTPSTVPGAPIIGTAIAGISQATVTFSAPVSNGGSAITGYIVTSNPGGFTGTGSASPITVTGLTNGTAYTFTVTATNANGTGPASSASNSVIPTSSEVFDIDGNVYNVIAIGTQEWLKENLKTTKYNDGTSIPNVTVDGTWATLTTGAYCDYSNNPANSTTYGRLYNWYAVDNNATTKVASNGGKNVCPTGWHVPSDAEWKSLEMYIGMTQVQADALGWRGTDQGDKLKETGNTHWNIPSAGTNTVGFTALPAGRRSFNGTYEDMLSFAYWWNSDLNGDNYAYFRFIISTRSDINRGYNLGFGFSVRCVRD